LLKGYIIFDLYSLGFAHFEHSSGKAYLFNDRQQFNSVNGFFAQIQEDNGIGQKVMLGELVNLNEV